MTRKRRSRSNSIRTLRTRLPMSLSFGAASKKRSKVRCGKTWAKMSSLIGMQIAAARLCVLHTKLLHKGRTFEERLQFRFPNQPPDQRGGHTSGHHRHQDQHEEDTL